MGPTADRIRVELERVLAGHQFSSAARLSRFLRLAVERTLAGRASELKEYTIGVEVYERGKGFDPRIDSIVRVEAGKLRARLAEFYTASGGSDVRLELPKGSYVPRFDTAGECALSASIAVLPFVPFGSDPEDAWFGDGLAEEVIDRLTRVRGVKVVARTSSFQFRGAPADVREIGSRLGVRYVVEGSIRRDGARYRVASQLIDTSDGCHVWSHIFEREQPDAFRLHADLAGSILEHLSVHIERDPQARPIDPNAYHLLLEGRYHRNQWEGHAFKKAAECFRGAAAADPACAEAWTGLAEVCCMTAVWSGVRAGALFAEARQAAQRAIALRPDLSQARVAMGIVRLLYDWDMHESLSELNQALGFDPGNASAWHWRALNLLVAEHTVECLDAISRARRLDPASLVIQTHAAMMLYFAGDSRGAMLEYGRVLQSAPDFAEALWDSAWLHEREGRFDVAIRNLERVCELTAPNAIALGEIGANRAFLGQIDEARAIAAELEEGFAGGSHASAYAIANVYAGLGDCEKVVHWLERGVAVRDLWLGWARIERRFAPFRHDPGFQACLNHVRLPGPEVVDASFD